MVLSSTNFSNTAMSTSQVLSDSVDHRARLLDGMARCVADKGYVGTTIADIVREASVSRRTFYEHFSDKGECLMALYMAATDNAIAALRAAIDPSQDWQVQVEQAIAAYLAALARNPVLLRTLFIDILGLGASGLAVRSRVHRQLAALVIDIVNQRVNASLPSPPLGPTLALAVVGGIHELVLQAIEQDRVEELHTLVAPASALLRAAMTADF